MFEQRIEVQEGEILTLAKLLGHASIAVWDEPDVLIKLPAGEESQVTVEQVEKGPSVIARVHCEVRVPAGLAVQVGEAKGHLQVKGISSLNAEQVRGNLKLSDVDEAKLAEVYGGLQTKGSKSVSVAGTIFGNTSLRNVGQAEMQNVRGNLVVNSVGRLQGSRIGGNLIAKEMEGSLDVDQVGGNATLKNISAETKLGKVAGNLTGKNLVGGAKVPTIGGNLVLGGEIGQGRSYQFSARGNAVLGLNEDTNAHLTLTARSKFILSTPLTGEVREGRTLSGTLGDGGAEIVVEAGGNVVLGGKDEGRIGLVGVEVAEGLVRQIEEGIVRPIEEGVSTIDLDAIGRQVGAEMEEAMSRLQVKLEGVDWDTFGEQTQQAVERAMDHLQRNLDRMAAKAARQQERFERKMERGMRRAEQRAQERQRADRGPVDVEMFFGDDPTEGGYEETEVEPGPDLDEERLSILRMLEQGQIAPEEAEMLLDALQ